MFWLTKLVGEEVVVLNEAKLLGKIDGFAAFEKNFVLTHTQKGWFLLKGLFALTNALVVEDAVDMPSKDGQLLNSCIFDTSGKFLANAKDFFVDRQCQIKRVVTTEGKTILLPRIFCIGDAVLVKNRLPKSLQTPKEGVKRQKSPKTAAGEEDSQAAEEEKQEKEGEAGEILQEQVEKGDIEAGIQPEGGFEEEKGENIDILTAEGDNSQLSAVVEIGEGIDSQKSEIVAKIPQNVQKHYGDFNFLLGRTCKKNIANFQGEVMVKRDTVINKDILRQAKISGKLIELALNCQ